MDRRSYVVDTSRWPLVRVVAPADHSDDASFEQHLVKLREIMARQQPYAVVVDARLGGAMPAHQRERLRQHRQATFFEA